MINALQQDIPRDQSNVWPLLTLDNYAGSILHTTTVRQTKNHVILPAHCIVLRVLRLPSWWLVLRLHQVIPRTLNRPQLASLIFTQKMKTRKSRQLKFHGMDCNVVPEGQ